MTSRDSGIDVKFRDKCKPSIRVCLVVQNRLLRETMARLFQKKAGIIVVGKECSVSKLPESAREPFDVLLMDSLKAGCANLSSSRRMLKLEQLLQNQLTQSPSLHYIDG